jgi:hypothetical protein
LGGKWEGVKRCFSFYFHWPPSNGTFQGPLSNETFQGPPNNGTLQRSPSNGTFQGPPSNGTLLHLFPFPSFEEGEFGSFVAFFFGHNFQFES